MGKLFILVLGNGLAYWALLSFKNKMKFCEYSPRTADLLNEVACFCSKVNNVHNSKNNLSKLVSTRRSTVLNLTLQEGFPCICDTSYGTVSLFEIQKKMLLNAQA